MKMNLALAVLVRYFMLASRCITMFFLFLDVPPDERYFSFENSFMVSSACFNGVSILSSSSKTK